LALRMKTANCPREKNKPGESAGEINFSIFLLIAATAKAQRLILATLNYRHFERRDGLAGEDWSR
jgi:predicted nucleic acid-binding protein